MYKNLKFLYKFLSIKIGNVLKTTVGDTGTHRCLRTPLPYSGGQFRTESNFLLRRSKYFFHLQIKTNDEKVCVCVSVCVCVLLDIAAGTLSLTQDVQNIHIFSRKIYFWR